MSPWQTRSPNLPFSVIAKASPQERSQPRGGRARRPYIWTMSQRVARLSGIEGGLEDAENVPTAI